MSDPASSERSAERERLVRLIMERDGVSREDAEAALDRAEAETLRMRDA